MFKRLNSLLLAFSSLAFYAAPVFAQNQARHSLNDGAWALQFSVNENFRLGALEGGTLSAKHHYSDATALRYGLTLSLEAGDKPRTNMVGFEALYVVHPDLDRRPGDPLQLYWGLGPSVAYQRQEQFQAAGEAALTQWAAGAAGAIGAEWFVHPRISLMAEYGTALQYERRMWSYDDAALEDESRSSIALRPSGVRLGISVYVRTE